ncbi:glucosamine-6-phosphate deaminase [Lacrimispora sp. NSJ-141]|uniref:Glucosamine-6-phosphate deaminase n=1 Tax=Lientehia hominis TaxID=2897778 RepID=A0AAP2W8Q4_9FIRM|nr:glucosamine-6-phosphate deaminase [Lientehia hominis]MCD2492326.1 glucosamine-6-phosphate deaminase [Lientehia hominis]
MKVIQVNNYEELGKIAGEMILEQMEAKSDSVLGLATGETPVGIYRYLAEEYRNRNLSFSKVRTVNLDEYIGMDGRDEQSYRYFMNQHLFDRVDIRKEFTEVPNGKCENAEQECLRYEKRIEEFGGIDIQILGMGENGHIGFNEPGSEFICDTHVVSLTEETREVNARFFDSADNVPEQAITMGIRTILKARKIILAAFGVKKAEALAGVLKDRVTPWLPASVLQFHPDVTVIADAAALSKCSGLY